MQLKHMQLQKNTDALKTVTIITHTTHLSKNSAILQPTQILHYLWISPNNRTSRIIIFVFLFSVFARIVEHIDGTAPSTMLGDENAELFDMEMS